MDYDSFETFVHGYLTSARGNKLFVEEIAAEIRTVFPDETEYTITAFLLFLSENLEGVTDEAAAIDWSMVTVENMSLLYKVWLDGMVYQQLCENYDNPNENIIG